MKKVFNDYAAYYDLLYQDKDYKSEIDYIDSLIKRGCPTAESILELGCGTGAHAEHLARKGYTVMGVDMSEGMVAAANQRKERLPADIASRMNFAVGDIRTVRFECKYDAVISLFHVLSYQTSNEDVLSAFETAKQHLSDSGVFIFDCWYGPAVLTDRPVTRVKRLENATMQVTRIAESSMDFEKNTVNVAYEMLIVDRANLTQSTFGELHEMRYFFVPEIDVFADLKKLKRQFVFEWMTERNPTEKSWNACFGFKNG